MARDSVGPTSVPSPPPPAPPAPLGGGILMIWFLGIALVVAVAVVFYLIVSSDDPATPASAIEDTVVSITEVGTSTSGEAETTNVVEEESIEVGVIGLGSTVVEDGVRIFWVPVAAAVGYEYNCSLGEWGRLPSDTAWFDIDLACETIATCAVTAFDDAGVIARGEVTEVGAQCSVDSPVEQPVASLNLWTENDPEGDWVVRFGWDAVAGAVDYRVTWQYSSDALGVSNSLTSALPEGTTGTEFDLPCGANGTFSIAAQGSNGADITTASIDFEGVRCGVDVAVGGFAFPRKEDTLTSGIRAAAVECPASTHLLAGGFTLATYEDLTSADRTYVLGNRPSGNGWEVTLAVPPGRQMKVEVSAICAEGDWQTSSVAQRVQVSGGTGGAATATCPAGTVRTAGGWWANPFLDLTSSVPAENGWQVVVEGEAVGGAGPIFAYAVCIEHPNLITSVVSSRASVGDGERLRSLTESCPDGALASGGGFASAGGVVTGSGFGPGAVSTRWATSMANWATPGVAGPAISVHLSAVCLSVR